MSHPRGVTFLAGECHEWRRLILERVNDPANNFGGLRQKGYWVAPAGKKYERGQVALHLDLEVWVTGVEPHSRYLCADLYPASALRALDGDANCPHWERSHIRHEQPDGEQLLVFVTDVQCVDRANRSTVKSVVWLKMPHKFRACGIEMGYRPMLIELVPGITNRKVNLPGFRWTIPTIPLQRQLPGKVIQRTPKIMDGVTELHGYCGKEPVWDCLDPYAVFSRVLVVLGEDSYSIGLGPKDRSFLPVVQPEFVFQRIAMIAGLPDLGPGGIEVEAIGHE